MKIILDLKEKLIDITFEMFQLLKYQKMSYKYTIINK